MSNQAKIKFLKSFVSQYDLNLSDLTVYTEAASGSYMLTPILPLVAGADHVYAQARDSRFGSAEDVISQTSKIADSLGYRDKISFLTKRCHDSLAKADIITNSGFVRPIDRDLISVLKPTAVVPLMWETWEFRREDFDLDFCKEKGILVLGTNERKSPCDMLNYIGLSGLKLLFELGYDGGDVLLLGNAPIPASPILEYLKSIGIKVFWVSEDSAADIGYSDLSTFFKKDGQKFSVILLAEHSIKDLILGEEGFLSLDLISQINPEIKIGIMCGNVNILELQNSSLCYYPKHIAPVGYMSYQPSMLGPRPVLSLYAAGLRVGEIMSRLRISGLSPLKSAEESLKNELVMDFEEELAWV